jgi:hypothetical protein
MEMIEKKSDELESTQFVAFSKFLAEVGRSSVTGWRWRRKGWIDTINIAGRPYVRREAIEKFLTRAEAGEFAKSTALPNRTND